MNRPDSPAPTPLSYHAAGVDIDAGDALVERIKPFAKRTMRPEVLAGIGGFGALIELPKRYRQPVLVATLVHLDRLTESSRLGRMFSEQIAGRMVQRGLKVTEVKMRESLLLQRDQGELLLSREVREVSQAQDAQAVVVGTYAVSASVVYISLKLVNPVGNTVVAAHNYAVPMDENVRALLTGR